MSRDHGVVHSPPSCTSARRPRSAEGGGPGPTEPAERAAHVGAPERDRPQGRRRRSRPCASGSTSTAPPPLRRRTRSTPAAASAARSTTSSRWVLPSTRAGRSTVRTATVRSVPDGRARPWKSAAESDRPVEPPAARHPVSTSRSTVAASSRAGSGTTPMPGPRGTASRPSSPATIGSVRSAVEVPVRRAEVGGPGARVERREGHGAGATDARSRACRRRTRRSPRRPRPRCASAVARRPPPFPGLRLSPPRPPRAIAARTVSTSPIGSSSTTGVGQHAPAACGRAGQTREGLLEVGEVRARRAPPGRGRSSEPVPAVRVGGQPPVGEGGAHRPERLEVPPGRDLELHAGRCGGDPGEQVVDGRADAQHPGRRHRGPCRAERAGERTRPTPAARRRGRASASAAVAIGWPDDRRLPTGEHGGDELVAQERPRTVRRLARVRGPLERGAFAPAIGAVRGA